MLPGAGTWCWGGDDEKDRCWVVVGVIAVVVVALFLEGLVFFLLFPNTTGRVRGANVLGMASSQHALVMQVLVGGGW